jgi:hypothetical protein
MAFATNYGLAITDIIDYHDLSIAIVHKPNPEIIQL